MYVCMTDSLSVSQSVRPSINQPDLLMDEQTDGLTD